MQLNIVLHSNYLRHFITFTINLFQYLSSMLNFVIITKLNSLYQRTTADWTLNIG